MVHLSMKLALRDPDLVAEHEDLDVLVGFALSPRDDQTEKLHIRLGSYSSGRRSLLPKSPTGVASVLGAVRT
jgi:hypothetical protein